MTSCDDGVLVDPGQGDKRERGQLDSVDGGPARVDNADGTVVTWE